MFNYNPPPCNVCFEDPFSCHNFNSVNPNFLERRQWCHQSSYLAIWPYHGLQCIWVQGRKMTNYGPNEIFNIMWLSCMWLSCDPCCYRLWGAHKSQLSSALSSRRSLRKHSHDPTSKQGMYVTRILYAVIFQVVAIFNPQSHNFAP